MGDILVYAIILAIGIGIGNDKIRNTLLGYFQPKPKTKKRATRPQSIQEQQEPIEYVSVQMPKEEAIQKGYIKVAPRKHTGNVKWNKKSEDDGEEY